MDNYSELRRMNAHDNSVTSVQSGGRKIVSGGSDGKVKEWDFESGKLFRGYTEPDAVWRVGYAGERIAAVFSKGAKVNLGVSELLISDQSSKGVTVLMTFF
jgi:F-box and WD-40 domain protein CDC4